jgi:hypothetical protein
MLLEKKLLKNALPKSHYKVWGVSYFIFIIIPVQKQKTQNQYKQQ